MPDISVNLLGMKLKNPVMPAAGPPVKDAGAARLAKKGGAGAIVTKTISVKPARVPRPNMAQIRGGFLNAELWSEMSAERWIEEEYPAIKKLGLPVIIGLGYTAEEISNLAPRVEPFADALELSTHYLGDDTSPFIESIQAAREGVDIPVLVKLSPGVDIPRFAMAAEEAGADGLVLINSFGPVLDIDVNTGRPLLGSQKGLGWLSGKAIFPLALRCVYEAASCVDIPVIGVGGISRGIDAVKMIMAGASAVQVCTAAILEGPGIYKKVSRELELFLKEKGINSLKEIRGLAHKEINSQASFSGFVPNIREEKCTGCGLCVRSCVYGAIQLKESKDDSETKKAVIDPEKCAACGLCLSRCNFSALIV